MALEGMYKDAMAFSAKLCNEEPTLVWQEEVVKDQHEHSVQEMLET